MFALMRSYVPMISRSLTADFILLLVLCVLSSAYAHMLAVFQNNDFHEIGDNIIALLGKTEGAPAEAWGMGPDGTKGEQPRFTRVVGNIGYACGLFEKQSSFYFQVLIYMYVIYVCTLYACKNVLVCACICMYIQQLCA